MKITSEQIVGEHTVGGRRVLVQRITWSGTNGLSFDILDGDIREVLSLEESFDDYPSEEQIKNLLDELGETGKTSLSDEGRSATTLSRHKPTAPRFELDEVRARAFLHRALRRYDGSLTDGEGDGVRQDENWTLKPGWNTDIIFSDELNHVENLIHQAIHVVGAITLIADRPAGPEDVDIELLTEVLADGDWLYQWRVSLPVGVPFALCSPYREEIRYLGWTDTDDIKAKGCRAAMGILREAVATANQILAAHADAGGHIPTSTT